MPLDSSENRLPNKGQNNNWKAVMYYDLSDYLSASFIGAIASVFVFVLHCLFLGAKTKWINYLIGLLSPTVLWYLIVYFIIFQFRLRDSTGMLILANGINVFIISLLGICCWHLLGSKLSGLVLYPSYILVLLVFGQFGVFFEMFGLGFILRK